MGRKLSGIKNLYINEKDILVIVFSRRGDAIDYEVGDLYKEIMGSHMIIGVVRARGLGSIHLERWSIVKHTPTYYAEPDPELDYDYLNDRY